MHNVTNSNENTSPSENNIGETSFNTQLAQTLFECDDINSKILACKKKAPKPTEGFQNNLRVLYIANKLNNTGVIPVSNLMIIFHSFIQMEPHPHG